MKLVKIHCRKSSNVSENIAKIVRSIRRERSLLGCAFSAFVLLALSLAGCGADNETGIAIKGSPYPQEQVQALINHVASVLSDRFPDFRQDVESTGLTIQFVDEVTGCEATGCARQSHVTVATSGRDCVALTSLAHELLHIATFVYDLRGGHDEPGFWAFNYPSTYRTDSYEGRIYETSVSAVCGF